MLEYYQKDVHIVKGDHTTVVRFYIYLNADFIALYLLDRFERITVDFG